jgi:hypothetical protein
MYTRVEWSTQKVEESEYLGSLERSCIPLFATEACFPYKQLRNQYIKIMFLREETKSERASVEQEEGESYARTKNFFLTDLRASQQVHITVLLFSIYASAFLLLFFAFFPSPSALLLRSRLLPAKP